MVLVTLFLARHCHAEHNEHPKFASKEAEHQHHLDKAFHDAPLTFLGDDQAMHTCVELRKKRIDVVVSSPLMRCVQTAQRLEDGHSTRWPVHLCVHAREDMKHNYPCNRHNDISETIRVFAAMGTVLVAPFGDVYDVDPYVLDEGKSESRAELEARMRLFLDEMARLAAGKRINIVVISHCIFIMNLLEFLGQGKGQYLRNGEVREVVVNV